MKENLDNNPIDSLLPKKSCWWNHEWSPWEDTKYVGTILTLTGDKVGRYVYQERRCTRCNKLELIKVTSRNIKQ